MDLQIEPMTFPKVASRMTMDITVVLNEKAFVKVSFFEDVDVFTPLDTQLIIIEGDEYKNWGNDDEYIKDIIYKKLNIQKRVILEEKVDDPACGEASMEL